MALTDKLTAIGNAIRQKTGKTDLIPLADMPNEILSISSGGSVEDNPVYYATTLSFSEASFPENYNFVLKVRKLYGLNNMFLRAKTVKSVKIISDINDNAIEYQAAFREASALETVDLTECNRNIKGVAYMCLSASALKSIYGALDFTNCTNTTIWLNGAGKLEDIEFVPDTIKISLSFQWCSKLSKKSITSAIKGLDNSVTGQTVTFQKTSINNAFGINVDDESTYTEEFVALRESKNNWIFGYTIV